MKDPVGAVLRRTAFGLAVAATALVAAMPEGHAKPSYTVDELLTACKEGDNVSRDTGMLQQFICNQYLRGFYDAYVVLGGTGYCFPSGADRVAEMRRAFIKWGVNNPKARGWAATDGVLATMKCP